MQDWDRWAPLAAPSEEEEAQASATKLNADLKALCMATPSLQPSAVKLATGLARVLGGPWATEARKAWGIRATAPDGPSTGEHRANVLTDPCAVCGVRPSPGSKHKLCGGCKAVVYCSKECQANHWKEGGHKSECSKAYIACGRPEGKRLKILLVTSIPTGRGSEQRLALSMACRMLYIYRLG